jgi:phytoene synthase
LLRVIPFHAARRKIYLPLDLLSGERLSTEEIFAGRNAPSLNRVARRLGDRAREHLVAARKCTAGTSLLAALPGALVPVYLNRVMRKGFDPFHTSVEVPLFRRQLALSRAAIFGRL